MTRTTYALGLGANRWGPFGHPARALDAAIGVLEAEDVDVIARSGVVTTPAMGGAGRCFANAALLVETDLTPPELLRLTQAIERAFGRRRGRRWGPRVLDIDILLWFEGTLSVGRRGAPVLPHPGLARRKFVLDPLAQVARDWRDPRSGLAVRHLRARLARQRPVDPPAPAA